MIGNDVWLVQNSHAEHFCLNVDGKAKQLNLKPNLTLAVLYCAYDAPNMLVIDSKNYDAC